MSNPRARKKMAARPRNAVDTSTYTGKFAAHLKALREKKKMSVDELSAISGIPRRTLFCWEAGTRQPLIGQLPQLADALGIKVGKLLPEN